MRLGGPIFEVYDNPDAWVRAVKKKEYRAAYAPLEIGDHPQDEIQAYVRAAREADILIAEVGAWCNPLSRDEATRQAALERCKKGLRLADQLGARCCVNIAGSLGTKWDGPYAGDMTTEAYDLIIRTVQEIIDDVQPTHTYYTLEGMPWMYPDDADCYLRMMKDIDRERFSVHLDPVNWINTPEKYFKNAAMLEDSFEKLGAHIRSIHAKDIRLEEELTVHLPEVRAGLGGLDYAVFLRLASQLKEDVPVMLEHLPREEDYDLAAAYLRSVAEQGHLTL
ncbi:MAG: sugar phosphate isomerase/epimerase [Anaerolineaceae bacterium]|nr:sugar phosphate isomerase/epimerase [Anaerolineaceae bacterium]